jgi:superfamily I DNA and RNA helicase
MSQEITIRDYAKKMVDVAYYETIPNKEAVTNVFEALIKEFTAQQTKSLTEQLAEANERIIELEKLHKQKVENIGILNKERHKLIEQLAEKEKEFDNFTTWLMTKHEYEVRRVGITVYRYAELHTEFINTPSK